MMLMRRYAFFFSAMPAAFGFSLSLSFDAAAPLFTLSLSPPCHTLMLPYDVIITLRYAIRAIREVCQLMLITLIYQYRYAAAADYAVIY